ncbi:YheC/YheD family protein [Oceanobacillus jeddahense]|uniref:YheC/YheD family protein n=1 Tax=Oceanobacillus jeddahense TaxID=1462527 RepID=A0ABY5JV08_9BACI|nr:YheC/YheD family protein [Oceanobacillus jeddahense]UUI02409.1 YheC/YheD family protein [Oceanobacillus jeddahense]
MKVGMLRFKDVPGKLARTVAYICGHHDIEFFYFTPDDVDLTAFEINGQFLIKGEWVRKKTKFPDVIDNAPMRNRDKFLYSILSEHSFLTTKRIGTKKEVFHKLEKNGRFKDVLIPYKLVEAEVDMQPMLDEYKSILLKPVSSNQGRNIYVVEQIESGFRVITDSSTEKYSTEAFSTFFSQNLYRRLYICQPFIDSKTKEGHPFDVRIHTRKNSEGNWSSVKIYPRIGIGKSVTSNISQGGGTSPINPFLEAQFGEKWKEVKRNLNHLSKSFPKRFQSMYNYSLDGLGIDLGIDKSGKLWLFEVNTYAGSTYFMAEASEARVSYYKYCANLSSGKAYAP